MRILLVKTTSMGDVIHNLPVASDIRRALPQAVIDWVVEEGFADIPRLHPAIAATLPVAVRRWRRTFLSPATWREIGAFRRRVRADFYDAVIDTQGLVKSALIAAQAHGRKFGHAPDSAREPLAARFYDRTFDIPANLHAVERNRRLAAAALGYNHEHLPLDYGIAHSAALPPLATPWLPAGDYAVLLTATSRADKEWPDADWRALGTALNATGLRCVLPAGSDAERRRAERLAGELGRAVAAPGLGLSEMAGLLAGARIVVGVDTGLVHLAAALGRPTLALYCASDPALTGTLGGVLADAPVMNLGGLAAPPSAAAVVAAALQLAG